MRSGKLGFLVLSGLALAGSTAFAQGYPSADSIIDQLRPRPGMNGGTRGIRPLAPSENAAPAAAPAPAHPAAGHLRTSAGSTGSVAQRPPATPASNTAEAAAPSVNLTVQFANDSASLTPAAIRTLDELGRALSSQALATYRFRIEGHTDTLGAAEHNQKLSEQRANAVVDYLVSKFSVDRSRLEAVGMGEASPLVQTGENVAEPRNRRVKVVNVSA